MPYRLTETVKWNDAWFANLKPLHKLLFLYLCDNCNIAGFIEYNPKIWAVHIGCDVKMIKEGLEGVERGITFSVDGDVIYIKKFLKHQKNYPLNEKNMAHIAILRCFDNYLHKFDCENIEEFIQRGFEGGSKGVRTSYGIGIGISNGTKKGKKEVKENIPTLQEFTDYAKEHVKNIDTKALTLKYKSWKENNWKDGNNKQIKNWKAKLLNTLPYISTVHVEGEQQLSGLIIQNKNEK